MSSPRTWHGKPGVLPGGSYTTGTIDFSPGTSPSPYAGRTLEGRYGPVPDDGLPSGHNSERRRMRPTAIAQQELSRDPGTTTTAGARQSG